MATRGVGVAGESKSLWNFSLAPGWSREEVAVLKLALQKYGMGGWTDINRAQVLPGKTISQMYLQTQKLVGQQSLGGFVGVHLDVDKVRAVNEKRTDVLRKGGLIINSGPNPTMESRKAEIEENIRLYGIEPAEYEAIEIVPIAVKEEKNVVWFNGQEVLLDTKEKEDTWESISKLKYALKLLYKQIERLTWEKEHHTVCVIGGRYSQTQTVTHHDAADSTTTEEKKRKAATQRTMKLGPKRKRV